MTFPPTEEQQAIIDAYKAGEDLVNEAYAGAGKTSTLRFIGDADYTRDGVYIAYNRAIADDAKASFPKNVSCSTAHSLAYRVVGKKYRHRLESPRLPSREVIKRLKIDEEFQIGEKKITSVHIARMVTEAVKNYCHSADDEIHGWHVARPEGATDEVYSELRNLVVHYANNAWVDIRDINGELMKFEHDHYLKLWGLTKPKLLADFVMLDEAQDANPVIAKIIEDQNIQRILVGDTFQAIYGWRGAIDAMANFNGTRLYLTQSFRFGEAIATEANKWLTYLGARKPLRGFEKVTSKLDTLEFPDAILCRTNSGAMFETIEQQDKGKKVALVGGGEALLALAKAADELRTGQKTMHPELFMFESWEELCEYTEEDAAGADLKVFVKLVNALGTPAIKRAVYDLKDERYADIVISTAHKAKGREWDKVRIAQDFQPPINEETGELEHLPLEEAMLAYVSVTRAREVLDRGTLSYIDILMNTPKPSVEKLVEWTNAPEGQAKLHSIVTDMANTAAVLEAEHPYAG